MRAVASVEKGGGDMKEKKRVRDALGGEHAGKKDAFMLDPDKIVLVEDRGSTLFDERALSEADEKFVLNIMAIGVHTPIHVRRNPDTAKIEVVAGRRRTLACREANRRLVKQGLEPRRIPAVVSRGDSASLMAIMISENEIRQADSPMNRARKMASYMELGRSAEDTSILFGCSVATVKNTVSLLDLPAAVRKSVDAGVVSVSDAYKLAKLEPEEAKKKVERLKSEAPRTGKKSKNSKKAREIVDGGKKKPAPEPEPAQAVSASVVGQPSTTSDLQAEHRIRKMVSILETEESINENKRTGALAALRWVLGDEEALLTISDYDGDGSAASGT
jgi:ParB family chromosome partitioning protein